MHNMTELWRRSGFVFIRPAQDTIQVVAVGWSSEATASWWWSELCMSIRWKYWIPPPSIFKRNALSSCIGLHFILVKPIDVVYRCRLNAIDRHSDQRHHTDTDHDHCIFPLIMVIFEWFWVKNQFQFYQLLRSPNHTLRRKWRYSHRPLGWGLGLDLDG